MKSNKGKTKRRRYSAARRRFDEPDWVALPDSELLDMRISDLNVRIEGTPLEERVERLYEELEGRGLNFRPHCWLSDEWFSPDGIPGIAIPFYLAHPRLSRLEKNQMLEVEGGTDEWCMKILRHEAGHTIDTAFQLHRRRQWRDVFGKYTEPYPESFRARPYSKSYVIHLEPWYAQSHPAEDFAETFAVWLKPYSRWRSQYKDWPALKKVIYVDDLMGEIVDERPKMSSRKHIDSIRCMRKTLREHYQEKRKRYGIDEGNFYDHHLKRMFSDAPEHAKRETAASFLRKNRANLRRIVSEWTGEYQYTIDQVLKELIQRCRELKLRVPKRDAQAQQNAMVMLTVQTMDYIHAGHHRFAL